MSLVEFLLVASTSALLGLIGGGAATYFLLRRQDRINLNSTEARVRQLVTQAEKNAENIVKEAELKAKDEIYRKREEFNREVEQFKNAQRDQERVLEKKVDALQQWQHTLVKKDRHLQQNERKIQERRHTLYKPAAAAKP